MALYMLRVQTICRGEGRTAVAAAAYRSATRLVDHRLEMEFDFRRKGEGVAYSAILAPKDTPAHLLDREGLWNAAEAADKRKDSVPAREILVALPHELSAEQRRELVEDFVEKSFVARGMIADVAIHHPGREGDHRNHHAHILLTTRDIDGGGLGKKNPDWTARRFVVDVRQEWAEVQNKYLERYAPDVEKVSEKSLIAQGLDRDPTEHLGPAASALERRGEATTRGEHNRDVRQRNAKLQARDDRLDRRMEAGWRSGQWALRASSEIIRELESVRGEMVDQRDAWTKERDAIEVKRPPSIRKLEAQLTQESLRNWRQAEWREAAAKRRLSTRGVPARSIALWLKDPGRAAMKTLLAWHEDLNRLDKARRETMRAKRDLSERRAWVKSPAGRAHIDRLREPALESAGQARTERRTLERKIKRMDNRIALADEGILHAKVAKRLGFEQLRTPPEVPATPGRSGANLKRYFHVMSAHARFECERTPEPELMAALKFIRALAPGAPIPALPLKTPNLAPLAPLAKGPRAPDLPDLPDF
jgi:MobA/MobL family